MYTRFRQQLITALENSSNEGLVKSLSEQEVMEDKKLGELDSWGWKWKKLINSGIRGVA